MNFSASLLLAVLLLTREILLPDARPLLYIRDDDDEDCSSCELPPLCFHNANDFSMGCNSCCDPSAPLICIHGKDGILADIADDSCPTVPFVCVNNGHGDQCCSEFFGANNKNEMLTNTDVCACSPPGESFHDGDEILTDLENCGIPGQNIYRAVILKHKKGERKKSHYRHERHSSEQHTEHDNSDGKQHPVMLLLKQKYPAVNQSQPKMLLLKHKQPSRKEDSRNEPTILLIKNKMPSNNRCPNPKSVMLLLKQKSAERGHNGDSKPVMLLLKHKAHDQSNHTDEKKGSSGCDLSQLSQEDLNCMIDRLRTETQLPSVKYPVGSTPHSTAPETYPLDVYDEHPRTSETDFDYVEEADEQESDILPGYTTQDYEYEQPPPDNQDYEQGPNVDYVPNNEQEKYPDSGYTRPDYEHEQSEPVDRDGKPDHVYVQLPQNVLDALLRLGEKKPEQNTTDVEEEGNEAAVEEEDDSNSGTDTEDAEKEPETSDEEKTEENTEKSKDTEPEKEEEHDESADGQNTSDEEADSVETESEAEEEEHKDESVCANVTRHMADEIVGRLSEHLEEVILQKLPKYISRKSDEEPEEETEEVEEKPDKENSEDDEEDDDEDEDGEEDEEEEVEETYVPTKVKPDAYMRERPETDEEVDEEDSMEDELIKNDWDGNEEEIDDRPSYATEIPLEGEGAGPSNAYIGPNSAASSYKSDKQATEEIIYQMVNSGFKDVDVNRQEEIIKTMKAKNPAYDQLVDVVAKSLNTYKAKNLTVREVENREGIVRQMLLREFEGLTPPKQNDLMNELKNHYVGYGDYIEAVAKKLRDNSTDGSGPSTGYKSAREIRLEIAKEILKNDYLDMNATDQENFKDETLKKYSSYGEYFNDVVDYLRERANGGKTEISAQKADTKAGSTEQSSSEEKDTSLPVNTPAVPAAETVTEAPKVAEVAAGPTVQTADASPPEEIERTFKSNEYSTGDDSTRANMRMELISKYPQYNKDIIKYASEATREKRSHRTKRRQGPKRRSTATKRFRQ